MDTVAAGVGALVWVDALSATAPEMPWPDAHVVLAGLTDRSAVARWILDRQVDRGDRLSIAVIAASHSVPDTLAAGAVIDALAALGIDYSSPEAALPAAAFAGLSRAVGHLISASETGQFLLASGREEHLALISRVDSVAEVREVRRFLPGAS